ncbi:NADH dehydrogenase [ubiquinone] iron-sulfur protein 5-B [Camellia lanceoleosa]|nr:NADH dehydrogenase [ubiquinone] iron-sulfur protein 5-B [Camellia lanceoleosa]
MASGWGITGNKGRCYDFWMDFSECMSRCREPKDCAFLREDYLECLHHSKEPWPTESFTQAEAHIYDIPSCTDPIAKSET